MALGYERITANPLEEAIASVPGGLGGLSSTPLELMGDRYGGGLFVQSATWDPPGEELHVTQSVDTEGAAPIATTIKERPAPHITVLVEEPSDPAATNYVLNTQAAQGVTCATAFAGFGSAAAPTRELIRDLNGFDYAFLTRTGGAGTSEGIQMQAQVNPLNVYGGPPYTFGVWVKGAVGGELLQLRILENGGSASSTTKNVTATTSWQWVTVTSSGWGAGTSTQLHVFTNGSQQCSFYTTGWCVVQGSTLAEFFDGTTPGCSWNGVPHVSSSTRPAPGGPRRDAIMADVEKMVNEVSRRRAGTLRRTLPNGHRVTYDLIGATLHWTDTKYLNAGHAIGEIQFTSQPYARGPEITTITDTFGSLRFQDYTSDLGPISDFTAAAALTSSAAAVATGEHLFYRSNDQYPLPGCGEMTLKFTPGGATITGLKAGVYLRYDATNRLECYVDDNGTNSRLRIDQVIIGTRTNVGSLNLGGRMSNGTPIWVRFRWGNYWSSPQSFYFFADAFNAAPTPTIAPVTTLNLNQVSGGQANELFTLLGTYRAGIDFLPKNNGDTVDDFTVSPYVSRSPLGGSGVAYPFVQLPLPSVPGTAPALTRLTITDDSNPFNDQTWSTWGIRSYHWPELGSRNGYWIEAETSTVMGSSAVSGNVGTFCPDGSGGGGNGVIVQGLNTSFSAVLSTRDSSSTQHQQHVGDFQVFLRMYEPNGVSALPVQHALQWSTGDFRTWTTNATVTPTPGLTQFLPLGQIHIPPSGVSGTVQRWQGRIVSKKQPGVANVATNCYLDGILLVPITEGSGTAQSVITVENPTSFVARDEFDQAAGNLTGKTSPIGGVWIGTIGATDFAMDTTNHVANRTFIGDIDQWQGRYCTLPGTGGAAAMGVQADIIGAASFSAGAQVGILSRYVDSNNYMMLYYNVGGGPNALTLVKRVATTITTLATMSLPPGAGNQAVWTTLRLVIDAAGRWWAYGGLQGAPQLVGRGQDNVLATGNTLQVGLGGIYDAYVTGAAQSRSFDNYFVYTPTADAAVFGSLRAEIRSDRHLRQDAAGVLWVPQSRYDGDYIKVPPRGQDDIISQVVVKNLRGDQATGLDLTVSGDKTIAQASITPRYHSASDV